MSVKRKKIKKLNLEQCKKKLKDLEKKGQDGSRYYEDIENRVYELERRKLCMKKGA